MFFEDMLAARLPSAGSELRPVVEKDGFFGDVKSGELTPVVDAKPPTAPVAWLPNGRIARAWQAVITGKPFESYGPK
jgi:hypothetical protein